MVWVWREALGLGARSSVWRFGLEFKGVGLVLGVTFGIWGSGLVFATW